MTYGRFTDGGRAYEILTPVTPSTWSNYLFNDGYHMEVSQTLQGKSSTVTAYNREAYTLGYRYFYVLNRETGRAFNPNYVPLRREPEEYSCIHGLNETVLRSRCDGVECELRAMVPVSGTREVWTVRLTNTTAEKMELSLFTVMGFDDDGVMGGECTFDEESQILCKYAFPYHVFYEDKERVEKTPSHYFMFSDAPIASRDMSPRRFWGCDDRGEYPAALKNGRCSNIIAEAEDYCGVLHHDLTLAPGEAAAVRIQVGVAASLAEVKALKESWNPAKDEAESKAYWDALCGGFTVNTPDENVNAFANYWLKKQITLLTRQNRGGTYCPVRNQLQDALGYSLVQPEEAKKFVYQVLSLQNRDGFIKQWYMTDGSQDKKLCLLRHTDGPLWLVIAGITLINQIGDAELFFDEIPYKDGGSDPVYVHLLKAVEYMYAHRGAHGLCLVGDGDWNDPINGMGRGGKGETAWSTFALIYAINLILEHMIDLTDPGSRQRLTEMGRELTARVNESCWMDGRYIVGYDDSGFAVGSKADNDRLFLNTQTWALIAGAAVDVDRVAANIENLRTPFGPRLLDRPFDAWDPRWGRISIKKSGTTENGSVYCHASMFKAYSDAVRGDGDAVYDTVMRTLPTNPDNPPEINLQLPLYIANYYYTLPGSANYGRSSCHYGTGTVAWMLLVVVEKLLGLEATVRGLRVRPNLPAGWDNVTATWHFRGARYDVTLRRGEKKTLVDGEVWTGEYLPWESGRTYQVEVYV